MPATWCVNGRVFTVKWGHIGAPENMLLTSLVVTNISMSGIKKVFAGTNLNGQRVLVVHRVLVGNVLGTKCPGCANTELAENEQYKNSSERFAHVPVLIRVYDAP